jgi:hypothetical protein
VEVVEALGREAWMIALFILVFPLAFIAITLAMEMIRLCFIILYCAISFGWAVVRGLP